MAGAHNTHWTVQILNFEVCHPRCVVK